MLTPSVTQAKDISSGIYDEAMVAFDHNNSQLAGYVNAQRGVGVTFSCVFYFTGKVENNKADIKSYFPGDPKSEVTKGVLTVSGKDIKVALDAEPGGCMNVLDGHESGYAVSYNFSLDSPAKKTWQKIVVVKSAKAYFYSAKNAPSHQKVYIVKGDGVGVISSGGDWLNVEYPWSKQPISGWMKTADFYNLPQ